MQIVMSENLGADWFSLTADGLQWQQNARQWVNATSINDMLSNNLPVDDHIWKTSVGTHWGGLYIYPRIRTRFFYKNIKTEGSLRMFLVFFSFNPKRS